MSTHRLASVVIGGILVANIALLSCGCAATRPRRSTLSPGDWRQVEALQGGTSVVITLPNDRRLTGSFKSLDAMTLTVIIGEGTESQVRRSDVSSIVATGIKDGLMNGALIGVGLGAATAGAILAVTGSGDGYILPSAKVGAPLLLSGAGGVLGAVIDRAHTSERLLYFAAPPQR
jgi:hypothetical protein